MKGLYYRILVLLGSLIMSGPLTQVCYAAQDESRATSTYNQYVNTKMAKRLYKLNKKLTTKAKGSKSLGAWAKIFLLSGLILLVLGLAGLTAAVGTSKFALGFFALIVGLGCILTGFVLAIWNEFQKS